MNDVENNKNNLVIYITAGYPSPDITKKLIIELEKAGVNAIEIGIPYSDPVADGPIIAEASKIALQNGINLDKIFDMLTEIKDSVKIPLYLMGYYATIYSYGEDKFIENCKKANIKGSIIPDLLLEEGTNFFEKQKKAGLSPILLAFPNTSDERLKEIEKYSGDFIYYVNQFGTTGQILSLNDEALKRLRHIKSITNKPIYAGFGVSNRKTFLQLQFIADGVIIGSALLKIIKECNNEFEIITKSTNFIKEILGK